MQSSQRNLQSSLKLKLMYHKTSVMFFKSHKNKATTKTQTKTSHVWIEDICNVFMKVNGLSIIQPNKKSSPMAITKIVIYNRAVHRKGNRPKEK